MYSSPLQEWYGEVEEDPTPYDYDQNPNLLESVRKWSDGRALGKSNAILEQIGKRLGEQINIVFVAQTRAYQSALTHIHKTFDQSFVQSNPGESENVRDRALRLKQQPHSMTPDGRVFSNRGKRRY